jgi:hypothetical protein
MPTTSTNAPTTTTEIAGASFPSPVARDARWVVRRALVGLGLLLVFVVGGALLYNASIDADAAVLFQIEDGKEAE